MSDDTRNINRIVHTSPRRVYGVEAKRRIDSELHGIACTLPVPKEHTQWAYDCRRKRLKVYGTVLRFIDWMIAAGASRETVLSVPDMLRWYAMDALDARDGRAQRTDDNPRAA